MNRIHSLIIGGTNGIGKALVQEWAGDADQVLSVIGRRAAKKVAAAPNVRGFPVDLVNSAKLKSTLKAVLREHGKINNLIFFQRYRGESDWSGDIDTGLKATKDIIESLAGSFDDYHEKSIVIVGSMADHMIADNCGLGYHVAKAGLSQMVRYYAVVLGKQGIRVNGVTPGEVLKEESKHFYLKQPRLIKLTKQATPLGRMAKPADITHAIEFLCSPNAGFITGQNLVVDGGLSLQWQGALVRKISNGS